MTRKSKHGNTVPTLVKSKPIKTTFFKTRPKIGMMWPTGKMKRDKTIPKHLTQVMKAFQHKFPRRRRRDFDRAAASLILEALEMGCSIYETKPVRFWAMVKASGRSLLASHHCISAMAIYDFVFLAIEARQRFLESPGHSRHLHLEGDLVRAVDSLINYLDVVYCRADIYEAYFTERDWATCSPQENLDTNGHELAETDQVTDTSMQDCSPEIRMMTDKREGTEKDMDMDEADPRLEFVYGESDESDDSDDSDEDEIIPDEEKEILAKQYRSAEFVDSSDSSDDEDEGQDQDDEGADHGDGYHNNEEDEALA
jgi:hypothetical protein